MFSFLVSFFINKSTQEKQFYFIVYDEYQKPYFLYKKVLTLTVETLGSILVLLFIVSFIFMDFSVILQMFLLSMISIQYILIVALISFYLLTFFYLSVLAYSIGLQQYFLLQLVDFYVFLQYLMLQTNYI